MPDDVALENREPQRDPTLLTVRGLDVRYAGGRGGGAETVHAVRGVDMRVAPGEAVGLLGESGCGKTSLAMALLGLLPPLATVSGRVELSIRGEELSLLDLEETAWQRVRGERVAVVFQQPAQSLSPFRRVGRQIADVLRAHGRRDRVAERVGDLLAEVGLTADVADAHPHQLSGGQVQRIVLCQALSCEPDLLLADEPTASLDSETATRILDLVARLRLRRGLALLWISHDPDVLERVSERLLVMHEGRIVERGETPHVLSSPQHGFTRALLDCRMASRADGRTPAT